MFVFQMLSQRKILTMQIEIRERNKFTTKQSQALDKLTIAVYPPQETGNDPVRNFQWAEKPWGIFIWNDDENLVSYVGVITRKVKLNDAPVLIGGIGSVKTAPDARGKGYATAGLQRATRLLEEEFNVDFSILFCRDELLNYYTRFGWIQFDGDVFVEQENGKIKFSFNKVMTLAATKAAPQMGKLDLCGMPW
jgi:predicted GNAT family N-acyltransferase